ncbi:MAG TPA: PP2C family protein-serine/threonine phosphatase [Mycobacteriales bacterium]|nr:PP2C family protein-serine/threonine phosphatase [Mycobacteriales bacterium]
MTRQLRPLSIAVIVVMLVITGVGAWVTRVAVRDQERRLLKERTNEVGLVLDSSISALPVPLQVLGGVLRATHESPIAFERASAAAETGSTQQVTFALIRKTPTGFVVAMAEGAGLHKGEVVTGPRARAFEQALTTTQLVPTAVIGHGATRALGFALGPPVAPAGTVLYREDLLGPIGAPRSAGAAPFSELRVVIYAAPRPIRRDVLAETTSTLPLTGLVHTEPLMAGSTTWTLQASAKHPLVGGATSAAPWIVLGGGVLVTALMAVVVEIESRRRRSALALYDTEHRVAEALQLSLLPTLPVVPGLGLAARYLPGSAHQEIGGDWFDVFALDGERTGIVIGDVVGHDIAAAAAMSKLQASLRAYASSGARPSEVLDRLDDLVSSFEISELVTVFYGVLGPPDADGERLLSFANGGHLPPFVRRPDGTVDELAAGGSLVLGAPVATPTRRAEAEYRVAAGSILLLFTDGLLEVPGVSLSDSLAELRALVEGASDDLDADSLCALVLEGVDPDRLRDDIAILCISVDEISRAPRVGVVETPTNVTASAVEPGPVTATLTE